MAAPSIAFKPGRLRRFPLSQIDAVVSAKLGTTRTSGNAQPACFNRQVAMYLAARVGLSSTTEIGRFYHGRDHSTVCHAVGRIEALRETDPEVDALLRELTAQLLNAQELASSAVSQRISDTTTLLQNDGLGRLANEIVDRLRPELKQLLESTLERLLSPR